MTRDQRRERWLEEAFVEHLEFERNLSRSTVIAYRREVARFVDIVGRSCDRPNEVRGADIRAFVAELWRRAFGVKPPRIG